MVDLRSLEFFHWVATLRSFSKAARRMNTTQPAVSQRIAALEAEMGGPLLEREPRTVRLTPRGRLLSHYCERFLDLRSEMLLRVMEPDMASGTVRLGVSETIGRLWLRHFLERAHALYPRLVIDLTIDVSPVMLDQLLKGDLDLCLFLRPADDARLVSRPLFRAPLRFFASARLDVGPEPLTAEALRRFPIITYPKATSPYAILERALRRSGEARPRIFANSSLTTMIQMTLDQIGLCVIPEEVVLNELADGRLKRVATTLDLPDHIFTATYTRQAYLHVVEELSELAKVVSHKHMASSPQTETTTIGTAHYYK